MTPSTTLNKNKPKKTKNNQKDKSNPMKNGMVFFENTLSKCKGLVNETESTIKNLNAFWLQVEIKGKLSDVSEDYTKALQTKKGKNKEGREEQSEQAEQEEREEQIYLSKWLAKTLKDHSQSLEELLTNDLNQITSIPLLVKGFVVEMTKDIPKISILLETIESKLIKEENVNDLLETLKLILTKKERLANFFEQEVAERSTEFSETLSKYLTHYCVLEHLVSCSKDLLSQNSNRKRDLNKKLRSLKNPLL
jgi:hypothetical protein